MRKQVMTLAGVSLLCLPAAQCCGVGEPFLVERSSVTGCALYSCPIAVGSELDLYVTGYADEIPIHAASVDKPALATVTSRAGDVVVRPLAEGSASLTVATVEGYEYTTPLQFRERAITHVVPTLPTYGDDEATTGADTPLVFTGTRITVVADHRDARDHGLLGHGLEEWSVAGGALSELAPHERLLVDTYSDVGTQFLDPGRVRRVTAGDERRLVVHARPDSPPFEADIAPVGSTAKLRFHVNYQDLDEGGEVVLYRGTPSATTQAVVTPLTATDRPILGMPREVLLDASVIDPTIAAVVVRPADRVVEIHARSAGETELTVTFDGLERRYRIVVR